MLQRSKNLKNRQIPINSVMAFNEKWNEWRNYENHIERAIFRDKAEKEQISTVESDFDGFTSIHFRGQYVASMKVGYSAYLRLGDHRPLINIVSPDGKYVLGFVPHHCSILTTSEKI